MMGDEDEASLNGFVVGTTFGPLQGFQRLITKLDIEPGKLRKVQKNLCLWYDIWDDMRRIV